MRNAEGGYSVEEKRDHLESEVEVSKKSWWWCQTNQKRPGSEQREMGSG